MTWHPVVRGAARPQFCTGRKPTQCASLPPPSLSASVSSAPRRFLNPLVLAYLGDAVWEAHTRRLEVDIEAAATSTRQLSQEASTTGGWREAPQDRAGNRRGRGGAPGGRQGRRQVTGRGRGGPGGGYGEDAGEGSSGSGGESGSLVGPSRQDRKQWSSAGFQALVFDALVAGGLPPHLPATQSPTSSPLPDASAPMLTLTPEELEVLRWGRNAAVSSVPRNVPVMVYKKATAVEVLVAHLYLTAPDRCSQLIAAAVATPLRPLDQQEAGDESDSI